MHMPKFMRMSWTSYGKMSSSLAQKIKKSAAKFDLIIGIARGGIPLAMVIGDKIGVRIDIINVKSYTGVRQRSKPQILSTINSSIKGKRILLVDDLIEEGDTMRMIVGLLRKMGAAKITTAVMLTKPWSKFKPDFKVRQVDRWVIFPWEAGEFERNWKHQV